MSDAVATPISTEIGEVFVDSMTSAGAVIDGSSTSLTITVNDAVATFPAASVAVNVLVVVPSGNAEPEARPAVCAIVGAAPELSVAVGARYVTIAVASPASFGTD